MEDPAIIAKEGQVDIQVRDIEGNWHYFSTISDDPEERKKEFKRAFESPNCRSDPDNARKARAIDHQGIQSEMRLGHCDKNGVWR